MDFPKPSHLDSALRTTTKKGADAIVKLKFWEHMKKKDGIRPPSSPGHTPPNDPVLAARSTREAQMMKAVEETENADKGKKGEEPIVKKESDKNEKIPEAKDDSTKTVFEGTRGGRPAVSKPKAYKMRWKKSEEKLSKEVRDDKLSKEAKDDKMSKEVDFEKDDKPSDKSRSASGSQCSNRMDKNDPDAEQKHQKQKKVKRRRKRKNPAATLSVETVEDGQHHLYDKTGEEHERGLIRAKSETNLVPLQKGTKSETNLTPVHPKESKSDTRLTPVSPKEVKSDTKITPLAPKQTKLETSTPPPAVEPVDSDVPDLDLITAKRLLATLKRNAFLENLLLPRQNAELRKFFEGGMDPSACTLQVLELLEKAIDRLLDLVLFKGDDLDTPIDNDIRKFIINRTMAQQRILDAMLSCPEYLPFAWGGKVFVDQYGKSTRQVNKKSGSQWSNMFAKAIEEKSGTPKPGIGGVAKAASSGTSIPGVPHPPTSPNQKH